MSVELRCQPNTLHGILVDGRLEIKCRDKLCGYQRGVTILHYFDPLTGHLVETRKFQDPANVRTRKEISKCH